MREPMTEMAPDYRIELVARIREEALRLGFFKVGITPARPLPDKERLMKWLREGMYGEMCYMERQAPKRLDPGLVLDGACSILVLALNYYAAGTFPHSPMKGKISRYAWGDDYHAIVKDRLEALLTFIKKLEPSARGLCYADTGPVMEKAWGALSAVGWMGKNTTLISRSHGSWFFIGVILLNIELEYNPGERNFCGRCDRCLKACPAGAIIAPYLIDARLCISYLTQLRGPIPRRLRPLMGNRIFGCDVCQEVCPWNRFAVKTSEPEFHPREGNLVPDLAPLVGMSMQEFSRRFIKSPIYQTTRDGFVRNVVVALGNSGSGAAVPALEKGLQDASPLVRAHAVWALGRIADKRVRGILESVRAKETHPMVLEEIAFSGQEE
jgi:epoxyqueuosine reductase